MPRMAWPRSDGDGDRMPTGQILVTAPLSIARSSTSASAARPSTSIGIGIGRLGVLQRAGVAEIAVGDARTGQKYDLQHPVENDRDLAEEKRAVEIWRQQNVVERQQRHRQHGRGTHDVVEVGQRSETPLGLVEAGKDVNETGIDEKTGQQDDQQAPTLREAGFLEPNKKARDHCRRRGEQIVRENEPHPRREGRKANHRPDIAAQRGIKAINTGV